MGDDPIRRWFHNNSHPFVCGKRHGAGRRPARRPNDRDVRSRADVAHIQTLGSDAFEGRGAGDPGRNQDRRLSDPANSRTPACRRAAKSSTASASGRRRCRCSSPTSSARRSSVMNVNGKPTPLTQGEQIAVRSPIERRQRGQPSTTRPGCSSATASRAPERDWDDFKGAGRHGQDPRRAGQRPRLRGRRRATSAARR